MHGGRAKNQIEYICISHRYRNGLSGAKAYPGADCGSDHVPVVATLRIKMKRIKKPQTRESFDREALCNKNEFTVKHKESVEKDNEELLAWKDMYLVRNFQRNS